MGTQAIRKWDVMSEAASSGKGLESGQQIEEIVESLPPSGVAEYETLTPRKKVCIDLIADNPDRNVNSLAENKPVSEESLKKVEEEHSDLIKERVNELENRRVYRERGKVSFEGEPLDATMKHLSEIKKGPLEESDLDAEKLTEKEKSILRMALRVDFDTYTDIHDRLESHGHHISYSHVRKVIQKHIEPSKESEPKSYADLGEKQQLAVNLLIEYYGNEIDESLYEFYKRKAPSHDISHGTVYNVDDDFQHIIWKWMDERERK